MPQYIVRNLIQTGTNEPVSIDWYKGDSLAAAIVAAGQSALHDHETNTDLPESMRFRVVSVRIDIVHDEPSDEPDPYTTTPTHVRIYTEDDEWFIDGADDDLRFTEMCWSFDSFAEAALNVGDFVDKSQPEVTWLWTDQRPTTRIRRTI